MLHDVNRKDLPRGLRERYDVLYCAYCAVFRDCNEGFTREQRDADPEDRFCVNWSNPRSRAKFRQKCGGCTMWPKMATTGKGNIFEIAADRRWAFSLTNAPGETRCIEPHAVFTEAPRSQLPSPCLPTGQGSKRRRAAPAQFVQYEPPRRHREQTGGRARSREPPLTEEQVVAELLDGVLKPLVEYDAELRSSNSRKRENPYTLADWPCGTCLTPAFQCSASWTGRCACEVGSAVCSAGC